jgi:hypothetical protein
MKKANRNILAWMAVLIGLVLAFFVVFPAWQRTHRERELAALVVESAGIIRAVEVFFEKHGRYPKNLGEVEGLAGGEDVVASLRDRKWKYYPSADGYWYSIEVKPSYDMSMARYVYRRSQTDTGMKESGWEYNEKS